MCFAKLYQTKKYGQILVKKDQSSSAPYGPKVRLYYCPPGLGTCSLSIGYEDTKEGWDLCDKYFNKINKKAAKLIIKSTWEVAAKFAPKTNTQLKEK